MLHGLQGILIPILGIIGVFGMPVLIMYFVLKYASKVKQNRHEEVIALIEKGQFDPEMLAQLDPPKKQKSPLYLGLIWLGIGLGTTLGFIAADMLDIWGWGLVPVFIGLALLIYHFIAKKAEKEESQA